jgi:YVTN family beta-propeller protein
MTNTCVGGVAVAVVLGVAAGGAVLAAGAQVRIVQTNSAGDNVHLIDPATDRIVGEIAGIEANHGAAAAPDGGRLYFTNEADSTLDIVDVATLKVTRKVPLSGHPNNVSIGRDGRHVYVAISQAPGAVDVIDTVTNARIKSIPIKGAVHNTFVTPDGKFVIAGSIAGKSLTAIDAQTEQVAWVIDFDSGVRPIAFEKNADGSTRRMFVQISDFHGFAVVDFAARQETGRVKLPELPPPGVPNTEGLQGSPSHGIAVSPDGKSVWANSKVNSYVYGYSLPDLKLLGGVPVGHDPDWLTFTPDGTRLYVANAGSNSVSVLDTAAIKELRRIPVGHVPKRNITAVLAETGISKPSTAPVLSFEVYKAQVEPIFMTKRPGHARCYSCHSQGTPLRLQRLAPGATVWSEEESRKNFDAIARVVVPGDPNASLLLRHPLAAEAGGDDFHGGGKHWFSQSDGEWQTLAAWVRGR